MFKVVLANVGLHLLPQIFQWKLNTVTAHFSKNTYFFVYIDTYYILDSVEESSPNFIIPILALNLMFKTIHWYVQYHTTCE